MLFRLGCVQIFLYRISVVALVCGLSLASAQTGQKGIAADAATVPAVQVPVVKAFSLQVLDAESLEMGKIPDRELRDFSFRLHNPHDKPLKLLRVRATCPCLSILESPAEITLAPGSDCMVKGRLDVGKVQVGPFNRVILVEVEGENLQLVPISGESVQMIDFDPAPAVELGTFAGVVVPWSRSILIKSRFTDGQQLELLEPPAHPHFDYKLSKLSEREFKFEITPKLPLPTGRLNHLIHIPTTGIEHYGPIQVGFFGTITGWNLALNRTTINVNLKESKADKSFLGEVKIIPDTGETSRGRRRFRNSGSEQKPVDGENAFRFVSKDEEEAALLSRLETWQGIAAEIQAELPDGVSLGKVPQADGILLKMKFKADYFVARQRSTILLRHGKRLLGRLVIVGRK